MVGAVTALAEPAAVPAIVGHAAPRANRQVAVALSFLLVLCLGAFATVLLPGPWTREYVAAGDFSQQFYAFQSYAAQRLALGQLPLWDPYIYGGQAHLADPQTALFYPVGLLINLLAGHQGLAYLAMEWRAAIDVLLAALFTYLFVGRIAGGRMAGVVGAVVFCFGGYLTSYPLPQLPVLEASIWLPLILYGLERGLTAPRPATGTPWFGLAGLAGAMLLLAGHGQTAMLAAYAVAGYALLRWAALRRAPLVTVAQFALAAAVAAGISAPQWLPTLDYLAVTNRVALSYAAASGGFQWQDYRQALLPGGYFLRSYYVGILPLLLGILALRRRAALGWLALALTASLLALGRYGPLYPALYGHLPGLASFEDQERAAYLVAFAEAVLAGIGAAEVLAWTRGHVRRPLGEIVVLGGVAIVLTVAGAAILRQFAPPANDPALTAPLTANVAAAALLAGSALLVLIAAWLHRLPPAMTAALLCLLPAINLLGANGGMGRTTSNPLVPLPAQAAAYLHDQPGVWRVDTLRDGELPRNSGTHLDLSFPRGNDPLVIARSASLATQGDRYKVWQLFNVQYLLSREDPGSGFQKVAQRDGFAIFRMLYPLPRAWAVRDVVPAATPAQALTATMALQQPGAAAVLESVPGLAIRGPAPPGNQQEQWLAADPERLHLRVTLTDNALLVISQPYAPGWTATVDGRPATLLRADYAFDGLALTAGSHDVDLRYVPAGLVAGTVGAVLALLLLLGSLLLPRRWSRRASRAS